MFQTFSIHKIHLKIPSAKLRPFCSGDDMLTPLVLNPNIAGNQGQYNRCWWPGPSWWRHQMETFSALLAICAGNSPVPGEFPTQRPVTRSFDVYFDLRPNKWLSKQSWGWWFETLSCSLWRHRNVSSPSQQQPWHWVCSINTKLSFPRKDFNSSSCHIFKEW